MDPQEGGKYFLTRRLCDLGDLDYKMLELRCDQTLMVENVKPGLPYSESWGAGGVETIS
jgi:hypothetical protein